MFRKRGQIFKDLIRVIDIIGLELIWLLSYYLRFRWEVIPSPYKNIVPLEEYLWIFIFFPFIWLFVSTDARLYNPFLSNAQELFKIIRSLLFSLLLTIAISFLLKKFAYSRLLFAYFTLLSFIFLTSNHIIWRYLIKFLIKNRFSTKAVIIDNNTKIVSKVIDKLSSYPELGIKLVGWVPGPDCEDKINPSSYHLPKLGNCKELESTIKNHNIQLVIICLPFNAQFLIEQILDYIGKTLVDIVLVPDFSSFAVLEQQVENFEEFSFLHLQTTRLVGWNLIFKRVFDFLGSLFLIIVFSPLFLLIAILIKLTSKGPVFFIQERIGFNEKPFKMIKFRTMIPDAEAQTGPVYASKNDPRVTKIGRILRKVSLDELPQLFNVLKGDMSLVGPRPERFPFVDKYKELYPPYLFRHKFKPGMTGWAQVNGLRQSTSIEKRLVYDLYYIKNWSFWFDLKILIMTLWKGFYHPENY